MAGHLGGMERTCADGYWLRSCEIKNLKDVTKPKGSAQLRRGSLQLSPKPTSHISPGVQCRNCVALRLVTAYESCIRSGRGNEARLPGTNMARILSAMQQAVSRANGLLASSTTRVRTSRTTLLNRQQTRFLRK